MHSSTKSVLRLLRISAQCVSVQLLGLDSIAEKQQLPGNLSNIAERNGHSQHDSHSTGKVNLNQAALLSFRMAKWSSNATLPFHMASHGSTTEPAWQAHQAKPDLRHDIL